MPEVEAWAKRTKRKAPTAAAVTMAITRYMESNPVDRRTKQAKAQANVPAIVEEAAAEIVRGQIDAFTTIQAYAERLNDEVAKLEQMKEIDPKTGAAVVPDFGRYYTSLTSLSKEMRGWLSLFVDIKDRLEQHKTYEDAFQAILGAVRAVTTAEQQQALAQLLRANPAVAAILRSAGGGG
jgi:hypothetical protein